MNRYMQARFTQGSDRGVLLDIDTSPGVGEELHLDHDGLRGVFRVKSVHRAGTKVNTGPIPVVNLDFVRRLEANR